MLLIFLLMIITLSLSCYAVSSPQDPVVNISSITRIKGIRDNQLLGYGIVIGLNGTGDSSRSKATIQSVANMLSKFGVKVDVNQIRSGNIAAVMVTATLP